MKIQIKLMGMLKDRTPEGGQMELPDDATIADALEALEVGGEDIAVFSLNGSLIRDREHRLSDADELTVLPPVGGG